MTISVALCTYNGEKFILPQLESIAQQTIIPDEVVICDDRSTDKTIELIGNFAVTAPYDLQLHKNETNVGSTKNFEKALLLCKGDIIFLCDQDDIWLPHKVEHVKKFFENNPEKKVVFTDAFMVDDNHVVQHYLWDKIGFNKSSQKQWNKGYAFKYLVENNNCATGATMAIKKEILPGVLPFDSMNHWLHDGIIALKTSINDQIGFIQDKLINYRQHSSQQMGVRKDKPVLEVACNKIRSLQWIKKDPDLDTQLQDLITIRQWVRAAGKRNFDEFIEQKISHLEKIKRVERKKFISKFFPVMKEWISGHYKTSLCYRNSRPLVYVMKDLLGI